MKDHLSIAKKIKNWPGLKTVFAIKTYTEEKGKSTEETSYFITSLDKSAKELLDIKEESLVYRSYALDNGRNLK